VIASVTAAELAAMPSWFEPASAGVGLVVTAVVVPIAAHGSLEVLHDEPACLPLMGLVLALFGFMGGLFAGTLWEVIA
jgi:hypothetical protein